MGPQIQPHGPGTAIAPVWTPTASQGFFSSLPTCLPASTVTLPPGLFSSRENLSRSKSGHTTPLFHILPWLPPTYLKDLPNQPHPLWPS